MVLENKFFTTPDLAEYLNVSKTTVYRLVETRKIAFYKIKGAIRFQMKDIEDYLEKNRVNTI